MGQAMDRSIVVKLVGEAIKDGRVSVRLLTKTLGNLQATVFQLANARLERDPSTRGRPPQRIERECELFLADIQSGSITATLELPPREASLFEDLPDFGSQLLSDVKDVAESLATGDRKLLNETVPQPSYRRRVVQNMLQVIPAESADYRLSLGFGGAPPKKVARPDGGAVAELADVAEPRPLYPEEVLVDAKCIVKLSEEGAKLVSMLDYEVIEEQDLRPFRPVTLRWKNQEYVLNHEIACSVTKEDHLVVVEYEPLGIRSYAATRDQAIKDFNEEFAFLWQQYIQEEEAGLSGDAVRLRGVLLGLVKEIRPV
ncbi:MAG: hypothetical protein ACYC6V_10330 [Bacillota bacterium]